MQVLAFGFSGAEEILSDGVCDRLEEALEVLARLPTLGQTICYLIRSLHVISSDDNQVDVSFSDPGLPFSAFVSVPKPSAENVALRIGEAMLHEAMHLQLTLVEGDRAASQSYRQNLLLALAKRIPDSARRPPRTLRLPSN